jgi:hypothetical protein
VDQPTAKTSDDLFSRSHGSCLAAVARFGTSLAVHPDVPPSGGSLHHVSVVSFRQGAPQRLTNLVIVEPGVGLRCCQPPTACVVADRCGEANVTDHATHRCRQPQGTKLAPWFSRVTFVKLPRLRRTGPRQGSHAA